ncbi:S8 family serine peptidase [soil metagenome]
MQFIKLFLFSALFALMVNTAFAQYKSNFYAEGELLVKFKNGTASQFARSANDQIGASVLEEFPDLKWQRVKLPAGLSVREAMAQYENLAEVEYVQPNFYYHLLATPNDPQYTNSAMYGLGKISAPQAWDLSTGSSNIVVADIDTGMRYTHEDLAANAWTNPGEIAGNNVDDDNNGFIDDFYGWDFFYNDSNPIDDAGGHGTHTAGTIGAVGNNSIGVVGVNWNVKIMPIKIYSPAGTDSTSTMLVNAYNYIRMMKTRGVNIRVTNNSYGGCGEACGYDQATKDALDAMGDADILNVFAAGNSSSNNEVTPHYPSNYTSPSVLAVAASTSTDARSSFSSYGATSVDIAAPGSGVRSTYATSNSSYANLSGTSMATPHVAGAAALLASLNPNLSAQSLKATLMNTVDPLPASWTTPTMSFPNGTPIKTNGRLNVFRAMQNQTVCTITLDRQSQFVFPEGGNFSINVTAPTNCDFSVKNNTFFVTITGGNPGSGNSTVTFSVGSNQDLPRSGTIAIGDQTFTVTQSGNKIFPHRGFLDFNGDGRTDFSAIQNVGNSMIWHNNLSVMGYRPVNFGLFNDDIPVPALYDNDLSNDIAVWRDSTGTFYVLNSSDNTWQVFQFGISGDNPRITQDFDGDDKADFAVTRNQGGNMIWYIFGTVSGFRAVQFGLDTDLPLRGDFDGDNKADIAVWRPSNGVWYILKSTGGIDYVSFGLNADKPVTGDYDGDGKTDVAVFRASDGVWHYLKSSDGSYNAFQFGLNGDLPTQGDYDGDGRTDFSVWRPNQNPDESGVFYIYSALSGFQTFGWGNSMMNIPANSIQNP